MDRHQQPTYPEVVRALMLAEGSHHDGDIEATLRRMHCDVVVVWSPQQALEQIVRNEPDLIVLVSPPTNGAGLGMIEHLKSTGSLSATVPIIAVTTSALNAQAQLALQQGGVWDVVTQPVNGAAFEARLRNYLSARQAHVAVRDSSLLDDVTGLYTRKGLETRVVELAAQCARQGTLLSCVAFTLSSTSSVSRGVHLETPRLAALGHELRRIGRTSDSFGRSDASQFVVLAPGANGADARQLANRLTRSITSLLTAQGIACDAPWVGRVLQPSRDSSGLGEELLSDTLLALQEVTAEHEIPASV
jgi:PleD family two-component response regulator